MDRNGEEAGIRITEDIDQPPELESKPRRDTDMVLVAFRVLSVITAVTALLCTIVNVLSVVRSFKSGSYVFEGILRCYAVAIALFVAVAETEWTWIVKFSRVLEYWVGRGMLQIFVAVMTKALSHEQKEKRIEILLSDAASWMLLACGVLYVTAGILCIGHFKESRIRKAQWREQAIKDLQEGVTRTSGWEGLR
ncbi:hypothetical protein O6H91_15G036500 [Diphasiastrum complanatum]|uniref:Uncharacterized protein n=1 Tax=Diphasiastrum complanatum TaxID=34168 RepID=A0ACC2BHD5_DIPCM|nr:hypothetical protein O6H91_15G036500 [Diphasiastrum complanatum]